MKLFYSAFDDLSQTCGYNECENPGRNQVCMRLRLRFSIPMSPKAKSRSGGLYLFGFLFTIDCGKTGSYELLCAACSSPSISIW